jgi:lambda repressor-like predicted transcriptional regulator
MDLLQRLLSNARRDRQIRRLRSKGWTMKLIAERVGLTRQRVQQVLAKPEDRDAR